MPSTRSDFSALVLLAVGVLLWLLNHPYQGIWHDARVYGLVAAHWLSPEIFSHEIFFVFGSQGGRSLYTPIFGELVRELGLDRASTLVVLVGALLWVGAAQQLSLSMLGRGWAMRFAVLCAAVMTVSYSPNGGVFVLNENFATARSWAMPLGLASVAAWMIGRRRLSLLLALLSTALHPLQGVWVLALWVFMTMPLRQALAFTVAPLVGTLLVGLVDLDVSPLRLMRGEWFDYVAERAPEVLFKDIGSTRILAYVSVLAMLGLGARSGSVSNRPLYARMLLLALAGFGMSLMASYWRPVEIVVQGQPWRAFWVATPLAGLALLEFGQDQWRRSTGGVLLIVAIVTLITAVPSMLQPAIWALLLISFARFDNLRRFFDGFVQAKRNWFVVGIAMAWLILVPGIFLDLELAGAKPANPWWSGYIWLHGLIAGGLCYLPALLAWAGGLAGYSERHAAPRRLLQLATLGLIGILLFISMKGWDRRDGIRRDREVCYLDDHCVAHPFRRWVPPGETVYWTDEELTIWFLLRTPSYFGINQGTGGVFSERKFAEWQRRNKWIAIDVHEPDPVRLCGDPAMDWIVVKRPVMGVQPVSKDKQALLYRCSDLRAVMPAPTFERKPL